MNLQLPVNPRARFIVGFSEGGMAAQYIAQKMKGVFVGMAGDHSTIREDDPRPGSNDHIAALFVLGDSDNMVPINGGRGLVMITVPELSKSQPLQQAIAWAAADGCSDPHVTEDKQNQVTIYKCTSAAVKQIIRKYYWHGLQFYGGDHVWNGPGLDGKRSQGPYSGLLYKAVMLPDKSEDDSRDIADFLLNNTKP